MRWVPTWHAQGLHLSARGDGVTCLRTLSREFDSVDRTDLTQAMADINRPALSRQAAMSLDGLRKQRQSLLRANARIVRAQGTAYNERQMCDLLDMLLPPAYSIPRQMVRSRNHASFNDHYNDYVSQVKAEVLAVERHEPGHFDVGRVLVQP